MKRLVLASLACAAILAVAIGPTTATPSFADLDHKVSMSKQPISFDCYTKCDHKGQGGVCITTTFTWTCAINDGYCTTIQQCIQ